ncbi:MAG: mechanosensitive ion channel family protein [Halioglobus sp.]
MLLFRRMSPLFFFVLCATAPLATAQSAGGAESIPELTLRLQQDIADLTELSASIDSAPEQDRNALVYRRDDRSFRLLTDMQRLVVATAELPADDPVREQVQNALKTNLQGAGEGVLQRIAAIGQRIAVLTVQSDAHSGSQLVVTEAFIQSLETLRFNYYQALVDVIAGREALGLPNATLTTKLLPILYLHGEAMLGRIEYVGGAMKELQARKSAEPDNSDLIAAIAEMSRGQSRDLTHLKSMIGLLEGLGQDPVAYKAVSIQYGDGLSISTLETSAVISLLEDSWTAIKEAIVEEAPDLLFQLLLFVVIVLVFRSLSRMTKKAIKAACERPGVDMSKLLKDVLISVCGGIVMVIGVLIALGQVGISLGPMLAGLGVAGFVVGFALQDTLGNFAAGGMILVYRPYDVDDFIEVAGASGLVKKMSLVSTTITTFDNQTLVIPNSKIWGDVIKNVTAQKLRRVDLVFGIGYSDDIAHAEDILAKVLEEHDMILSKPEAMIKVNELGDSSVNFVVRPWVKTEDYWNVYWDITREVKIRFDQEGISIPFPQRDVHVYQEGA